jgi:hypothetical protein
VIGGQLLAQPTQGSAAIRLGAHVWPRYAATCDTWVTPRVNSVTKRSRAGTKLPRPVTHTQGDRS